MIGGFLDFKYVFFLLTVACIVFPILSLAILNIILDKKKVKSLFKWVFNISFGTLFLLFQQNLIRILPNYFITVLIIECLVTTLFLIYLIIKVVNIWRN